MLLFSRKILWKSGLSPTVLKNMLESASWSGARVSSMSIIFISLQFLSTCVGCSLLHINQSFSVVFNNAVISHLSIFLIIIFYKLKKAVKRLWVFRHLLLIVFLFPFYCLFFPFIQIHKHKHFLFKCYLCRTHAAVNIWVKLINPLFVFDNCLTIYFLTFKIPYS